MVPMAPYRQFVISFPIPLGYWVLNPQLDPLFGVNEAIREATVNRAQLKARRSCILAHGSALRDGVCNTFHLSLNIGAGQPGQTCSL